jgi:hypothetical protein
VEEMKWVIYRYCIPIGLIILVAWLAVALRKQYDATIVLSAVGGILLAMYSVQKQKLEETRLLKELFMEFTSRYDKLNEDLNRILSLEPKQELTKEDIDVLYNYFNLCGEEYFYYQQGFIHPKVWKAWCNGIKIFCRNEKIGKVWAEELKNDSYYGFQLSELEKN